MIEKNLTDQEQMISNNTDYIDSLKEEVKSNAAFIRDTGATIGNMAVI